MPTLVTPSPDYLRKFLFPLWQKLDLEDCKPLQIVEGEQDGFPFTIIEMEHVAYGLLADNGRRTVSTFFIVGIPRRPGVRRISRHPAGFQASVDRDHVYLGEHGRRPRPREWNALLALTIGVAQELDSAPPGQPSPRVRPAGAGAIVYGFWTAVCALAALFFGGYGLGVLVGLFKVEGGWTEVIVVAFSAFFMTLIALLIGVYHFVKLQRRL